MSRNELIEDFEKDYIQKNIPDFKIGDTIKVSTKIIEGSKERVQSITGVVIARKGGGLSETFTLYRTAYNAAMERVFPLHSPRLVKIEVVKLGKVRRGKLYHLRGEFGKRAKVEEKLSGKKVKTSNKNIGMEGSEVYKAQQEIESAENKVRKDEE